MIHSAICKQVDSSEQSGNSTPFQVGGDNPKVEEQEFF
jgi:hypothetical protein